MPEGRFKSRTFRRISKRLPSGKTVTQYEKRKPSTHKCASCKKPLKGIPRVRPYKMKLLGKSQKSPQRPFGGYLCSACAQQKIKSESRVIS